MDPKSGRFFGLLIVSVNLYIYSFQRALRFSESPSTQRCINAVYGVQRPVGAGLLSLGGFPLEMRSKQLPRTVVMSTSGVCSIQTGIRATDLFECTQNTSQSRSRQIC